jgi:hypothetical protein
MSPVRVHGPSTVPPLFEIDLLTGVSRLEAVSLLLEPQAAATKDIPIKELTKMILFINFYLNATTTQAENSILRFVISLTQFSIAAR